MTASLFLLLAACALAQQQPRISNARVETVARSGGFDAQLRQLSTGAAPLWIGYTVPRVQAAGASCCYWDDGFTSSRGCGLEPSDTRVNATTPARPVLLEGQSYSVVLLRYEAGNLIRMRSFSLDCELDGGGLRVILLGGVSPAESITLLSAVADPHRQSAMRAIAAHADPAATRILEELALNPQTTDSIRRSAISLLGSWRGTPGYEALMRIMARSQNDETTIRFRERAVSALAANSDPRAADALRAAVKDRNPRVRSEAVQGLARKPGSAGTILESVRKDSDANVRKRAVNALSRLPESEGVPVLIDLARDASLEPALRKEAVTSLGRTKDPKAQAFLEQLLAR